MKNYVLSFALLFFSLTVMSQTPVKKIPNFLFYRSDGTSFTKTNIPSGKKVFFVFFDSDCDHCQHAVHTMDLHYKEFNKTEIYLVTLDSDGKIREFFNKYGPDLINKRNVTVLRDVRNEFISDFNPRRYPSMLLYSSGGELLIYQDDPEKMFEIFKKL